MQQYEFFLSRCIELASNRLGFCAPNPAVGCVVVKNDKIISEGFHFGCGYPHAEVDALNKLNEDLHDAILYVSLEPCCHYGRTPPCTERIKQSGIKKVFFGLKDPNDIVAGKGQAELIRAGIACELITLPEIQNFYLPYIHWSKTKMPWVIAKLAMSADRKIALANKKPTQISGLACNQLTHRYRQQSDAILTTAETIIQDNPQLNARINNLITPKNIYIIDTQARLPLTATIFNTAKSITLFHSESTETSTVHALEKNNVRCISIPTDLEGLNLKIILEKIGSDGVHQLWIEAGPTCFNAFLKKQLLHRAIFYISEKKLGDDALSANVDLEDIFKSSKNVSKSTLDDDLVYEIDLFI